MKRGPKPKSPDEKLAQLTIRLAAEEADALAQIAALHGVSLATAARMAIRTAWAAVTPAQKRALAAIQKVREESK